MSTKKEIVVAVAEKLNITQLAAKEVVQNVLDCVADTLVEEQRIELRNFGVFEIKKRAARNARNPKTGASVKVKKKGNYPVDYPAEHVACKFCLFYQNSHFHSQMEGIFCQNR